jgi:two-component system, chemotaxis family, protein-glutamate methylesterase/glutaminase
MDAHTGVVVVGGSAGGIEALLKLVAALTEELPAPVLVTVHTGDRVHSNLPQILSRAALLPASHGRHGERLRPGHIYVAPPDFHLLMGDGRLRLSGGPRVNRYRPAVDVMFASAARWAGPATVAVVLSGLLDDGAVGAALVARAGGCVIVQDPERARFDSMPRSALSAVPTARVAAAEDLGGAVCELLQESSQPAAPSGGEHEMARFGMADSDDPGFLTADEARLTRLSSALEEQAALAGHLANGPVVPNGTDYRRASERSADVAKTLRSTLGGGKSEDPA